MEIPIAHCLSHGEVLDQVGHRQKQGQAPLSGFRQWLHGRKTEPPQSLLFALR